MNGWYRRVGKETIELIEEGWMLEMEMGGLDQGCQWYGIMRGRAKSLCTNVSAGCTSSNDFLEKY